MNLEIQFTYFYMKVGQLCAPEKVRSYCYPIKIPDRDEKLFIEYKLDKDWFFSDFQAYLNCVVEGMCEQKMHSRLWHYIDKIKSGSSLFGLFYAFDISKSNNNQREI